MESWKRMSWGSGVIGVTALVVILGWISVVWNEAGGQTSQPQEPLVPTPIVALSASTSGVDDGSSNIDEDGAHYQELASRRYASEAQPTPAPLTTRWRTGVGVPAISPLAFDWPSARPGWYLTWSTDLAEIGAPNAPGQISNMDAPEYASLGMEFAPMVRMKDGLLYRDAEALASMAQQNRGRTWLIGNEPDVPWQDNTTPEAYALAYHEAYTAIKAGDPDAQVAIAGLSQITPLRLAYLDRARAAYEEQFGQPMPVDVWNMHAFVLREERDNWGVSIPPGFDEIERGILWELEDHDDLRLVENQVRLMRSWMTRIGEGDKPLWITEYGILMPEEYGFSPEKVEAFMTASFDLFDTLRDERTGNPDDDHRLVQRWAWFSTYFRLYPTGNLFDVDGQPTELMESMSGYLERAEGGQ